ncbi:MAG: acyltransferase [Actinobacteria bacterium]|nr:acyltransferase [Actinomycetota bacterium]
MGQFIRQLTGVRFVAAFWVVLYHYQPAFATAGLLVPVVHEFLRVGSLGVDLFFALSGFILTYTYLEKLGPAFKARGAGRFLWLRLARIYPVHFVMLNVAGLAVIAVSVLGAGDARERSWLNPLSYLKQLFLVQEWGPDPSRGWNFVAWSLSMEWFAYLFFPFVALILWRLKDRLPTPALAACAFLSLTPLLYIGISRDNDPFLTLGWASSVRVLTEFIAGAFVYLVVRRLKADGGGEPSRMVSRVALILSWLIPLVIVTISVVLGQINSLTFTGSNGELLTNEAPRFYVIIIPFLITWIGALALNDRGPASFLSHRRLVLGGFISYSLYMVHLVWFGLWRAGMSAVGIDGGPLYLIGLAGLIVMAVVFAYGMWRFVEEPAREWLRSKIGVRAEPAGEAPFVEHRHDDDSKNSGEIPGTEQAEK